MNSSLIRSRAMPAEPDVLAGYVSQRPAPSLTAHPRNVPAIFFPGRHLL